MILSTYSDLFSQTGDLVTQPKPSKLCGTHSPLIIEPGMPGAGSLACESSSENHATTQGRITMQWHVWIRLDTFGPFRLVSLLCDRDGSTAGDSFLICLRCLLFRTLSFQFGLPHHNKSIFQRILLQSQFRLTKSQKCSKSVNACECSN